MIQQGPSALIEYLVYGYDANGNRTSFGRNTTQTLSPSVSGTSHDNANEMLAYNSKNLVYDANGNLQTRTDVCGTTTYTWDARNRLTGINGYKPDCSALTASFIYDAINRRISKTINGTTMQFVYDGRDIIQEIKAGVKTNYVRTLNLDEPLTRITGSTVRHYLKDALGSVMALADDTGATKTTYVYDAFGNVTASGETSDNPFQYTGRENDGTGLYYYRARYYSPEMQRFISEDPIRLKGGINFYSYTRNNPVNWRDPLGLFQVGIVSNIGGFDFSAVLYDSKSGWLPPQPPIDIRISTSILGAALTIRTDNEKTPCDKLYGNTSLETTWGINRFFGISYDPAMTHTTYNIGAGVATPILSYSGSVSGFATSVGNAISSLFGN
jgi:RHS repeat-associated protein